MPQQASELNFPISGFGRLHKLEKGELSVQVFLRNFYYIDLSDLIKGIYVQKGSL